MPRAISRPDPKRFNLASFADLLPGREHIIGEDPGSFAGFREGMMRSLAPTNSYECVIAENLVAIEWELLQQRRMREAGLRRLIRDAIRKAVIAQARVEARGDFDLEVAAIQGEDLAERAVSRKRSEQAAAYAEIAELGMEPVELMAEAYRSLDRSVTRHDEKAQELERRRREVRREYDSLVNARPVDAQVIEG